MCRPHLFVVGTGRCGSTLLGRLLGNHPQLACIHELLTALGGERVLADPAASGDVVRTALTTPDDDAIALLELGVEPDEMRPSREALDRFGPRVPRALLAPLPRLLPDPLRAHGDFEEYLASLSDAPLRKAVERALDWLADRARKPTWVEQSGSSGRYLDDILSLWPDAKIVHVHRAGPACAVSMSRHPYFQILLARRLARDPKLAVGDCLRVEVPLHRFGAYWSAVTLKTCSAIRRVSERDVLHVSYDALVREPDRLLRDIEQKLFAWGISADEQWAQRSSQLIRAPQTAVESPAAALSRACRPGSSVIRALTHGA